MKCAACGAENRAGRRFCGQCGNPLARACPACGAANDAEERFCGECGSPIDSEVGSPARVVVHAQVEPAAPPQGHAGVATAATAERRHVSILFVDLVGFTALSADRDAEDVRELLTRYFETARTIIGRYGGTVEKFIGDAVMAVWGVPSVNESDAERAVRAALELVDAVEAFAAEVGAPGLRARAGVLTGEAVVNLGVMGEGMVAGDLVNTASRVQSVADPGAVLVGEATRQASEAAIVYEDAGTRELKGKPEPVRLWRARRVVAGTGGLLRPSGLEPPFVGRERELRMLKEFFHATAEEGKARLLSVIGVAGVGKSRLGWEFLKYTDGLPETIWYHRGRCLAYGEGVVYWALAEMVRMRTGIVENEAGDAAREKLRATVTQFIADEEERRWVEPRLAQLIGLEERFATEPRELYAAWRFFFERLAAQHPTLLIFEDLQWADSGMLDFIEYLLEWSRGSPILVITLARPELGERRPGWGTGKRGFTSLYLEPLAPDAIDKLLEGLVPGLPEDLRVRIRDRAAGVPLYAVETVRMLLDRGLLVEEAGTYRAAGSLDDLDIPESLHALIAARLDSLAPGERRLLQDAAVLGKSFTAAALEAISGSDASHVESLLRSLVNKDLLVIQSDPRSPEHGQYTFVQDLVRGVAYGTLPRRERKQRHLAAATFLVSAWTDPDEVAEVVASHLVEAYDSDPDAADAAAIRDRARDALTRAGDRAASLASATSAQRYYTRALDLGGEATIVAALEAKSGTMALLQGQGAEAREHYERGVVLYREQGDIGAVANLLARMSRVDWLEGTQQAGIDRLRGAFTMLTEDAASAADHEADIARIAARLSKQLFFTGDLDDALGYADQALQIAEAAGLREAYVIALDAKSCALASKGRRDEAELLSRGALGVALEYSLDEPARVAAHNLAAILEDSDRLEEALAQYQQAVSLQQRGGDQVGEVFTRLNQMKPMLELGRWDDCVALFADCYTAGSVQVRSFASIESVAVVIAWLHLWRGDTETARTIVEERAALLENSIVEQRGEYDAIRAGVAGVEGRFAEALDIAGASLRACLEQTFSNPARSALIESVEAAFALRREDTVRELIQLTRRHYRPGRQSSIDAHIRRWNARLAASAEDTAEVVDNYTAAESAFAALRRPFWLAVTRLEHAEWLNRHGQDAEARPLLEQALATFSELEARPWVTRAAAAMQPMVEAPRAALPA